MTITPYYPEDSAKTYRAYYADQVGHGIGVFQGSTTHRGAGIGSFLSGLAKTALPLIKFGAKAALPTLRSAGRVVGKELLSTGTAVASDLLRGENIRQSAKRRFKDVGKNVGSNLLNNLIAGINGSPQDEIDGQEDLSVPPSKRRRKGTKRSRQRKNNSLFQNVHLKA